MTLTTLLLFFFFFFSLGGCNDGLVGAVCAENSKCARRSPKQVMSSLGRDIASRSQKIEKTKQNSVKHAKRRDNNNNNRPGQSQTYHPVAARDGEKLVRLTLIRRLRQVKHPVFVLRLISFLCLPPDITRPSEGGIAKRGIWVGSEVTLRCCGVGID